MTESNISAKIDELIKLINDFDVVERSTNIKQRQLGAIFGAIVGDAASRPLHWVYKDEEMDGAITDKYNKQKLTDFAFYPQNICPFYNLPTGSNSCYGDQLFATLKSLSICNKFDINHWKQTLFHTFGGINNMYQTSIKLRDKKPVNGPWLHVAMIDFCKKYESKEDNTASRHIDNDAVANAIPVIAYLANNNKLVEFPLCTIKALIESIIASPDAIIRGLFVCKLLWQIISRGDVNNNIDFAKLLYIERETFLNNDKVKNDDMYNMVYNEVCDVMNDVGIIVINNEKIKILYDESKRKFQSVREAVKHKKYGKACGHPGSFKGPLYNILINGNNYKQAILDEIESGGDNCSRAIISGSIIGAINGYDSIPKQWINKTNVAKDALKYTDDKK